MEQLEKLIGKLADWNLNSFRYLTADQRKKFDEAYNILLEILYSDEQ